MFETDWHDRDSHEIAQMKHSQERV